MEVTLIDDVEEDQNSEQDMQVDKYDIRFNHKRQAIVSLNNSLVMGYEFFSEPIIDDQPVSIMSVIDSIKSPAEMEKFDKMIIASLLKNYIKRNRNIKKFINISSQRILDQLDPNLFYKTEGIVVEIQSNLMVENLQLVKNKIDELKFYNIEICIDGYDYTNNPLENLMLVKPQYTKLLKDFHKKHFGESSDLGETCSLINTIRESGTEIICGHIENLEMVRRIERCDILGIQGYFVERPIS
jgi:EAL domain-containing protein (putative c-di-GMP-specific phosphodiesterase class I)